MEDSLVTAGGFKTGVFSQCMKGERILTFSCFQRRDYFTKGGGWPRSL